MDNIFKYLFADIIKYDSTKTNLDVANTQDAIDALFEKGFVKPDIAIDCNSLTETGIYDYNGSTLNRPNFYHASSISNGGKILVVKTTSATYQLAFISRAIIDISYIGFRTKASDWSDWKFIGDNKQELFLTNLTSGADLNDYLKAGVYGTQSASETSAIINKPLEVSQRFVLRVIPFTVNDAEGANARVMQEMIPLDAVPVIYRRIHNSSGWGGWYKFSGTAVS